MAAATRTAIRVDYLTSEELASLVRERPRSVAGVIVSDPGMRPPAVPAALLAMPQLNRTPLCEVWTSSESVQVVERGSISVSYTGDLIFGIATGAEGEDITESARQTYRDIIACVRRAGGHLVRMWNYFPRINEIESIERYRRFCVGRYDAFAAEGYNLGGDLPAGTAVGSQSGGLVVAFIASTSAPRYLENRRQVSAFRYPDRYGPRSPSFARGALLADESALFVSGTASIVGHETVHPGNVREQLEETLRNIDVVIEGGLGPEASLKSHGIDSRLKVYLRHPEDYPIVASRLEQIVPTRSALYLNAAIYRPDLLVEIEAFVTPRPTTASSAAEA